MVKIASKIVSLEDQFPGNTTAKGGMRPPGNSRLRITFAANLPLEDVQEFFDTGFGGFGEVVRGESPHVLYLVRLDWPRQTVVAQIDVFQKEGMLKWDELV